MKKIICVFISALLIFASYTVYSERGSEEICVFADENRVSKPINVIALVRRIIK